MDNKKNTELISAVEENTNVLVQILYELQHIRLDLEPKRPHLGLGDVPGVKGREANNSVNENIKNLLK